jgi:hypothetical protein
VCSGFHCGVFGAIPLSIAMAVLAIVAASQGVSCHVLIPIMLCDDALLLWRHGVDLTVISVDSIRGWIMCLQRVST